MNKQHLMVINAVLCKSKKLSENKLHINYISKELKGLSKGKVGMEEVDV